jgi:DNA-binding CsgD family transcriptional regulator
MSPPGPRNSRRESSDRASSVKRRGAGRLSPYEVRHIFEAMPALARGDAERLLRFVAEAESFGGDHPFEGEFLTQLGGLVPADWVSYAESPPWPAQEGPTLVFYRPGDQHQPIDHIDHEVGRLQLTDDPIMLRIQEGSVAALKLSDFWTRRDLHRTRLYHLLMKPFGVEDSLGLLLPISPTSRPKMFGLNRGGRGFSERDRDVLDLLSPQLARLYRADEARRRLHAVLALHESSRAAVVLLGPDERVLFASTAARELLERYFGTNGGRLPEQVMSWLGRWRPANGVDPLQIEDGNRTLVVERVDDALLLSEGRPMPRLTPREREILDLVAEGRTNAEIAERLWVSPLTVRKHLENIYAKLGVHTRMAAAAFVANRQSQP